MMRRWRLLGAVAAVALVAAPSFAQTPMDDPLDARDAKRVDRMEKVVRELRDIVFKAQKTGAPVVVQPADTDARIADQAAKVADLEQSLTKINGALDSTSHELDLARRENASLKAQLKTLSDRLTADEQKAEAAMAAATAPPAAPEAPVAPVDPKAGAADAFAKARQMMLSGDYDNAAGAFIGAIRGWPQTPWAPDAVVELSRALVALKKPADACQTLGELGHKYPKAPASVLSRAATVRLQAKCS